jgi:hypothetical protein
VLSGVYNANIIKVILIWKICLPEDGYMTETCSNEINSRNLRY